MDRFSVDVQPYCVLCITYTSTYFFTYVLLSNKPARTSITPPSLSTFPMPGPLLVIKLRAPLGSDTLFPAPCVNTSTANPLYLSMSPTHLKDSNPTKRRRYLLAAFFSRLCGTFISLHHSPTYPTCKDSFPIAVFLIRMPTCLK